MIFPHLERHENGVAFDGLAPAFVMVLLEVPELLGPDQPDEVRDRLIPNPGDDPAMLEDWKRYVHPELFALLASAREIVTEDLGNLKPSGPDDMPGCFRLEIPGKHVQAWISGLNGARLALGALHGIDDEDAMHPEFEEPVEGEAPDALRLAVAKIHLLGELQAMLIFEQSPPPDDEDEEADVD